MKSVRFAYCGNFCDYGISDISAYISLTDKLTRYMHRYQCVYLLNIPKYHQISLMKIEVL